MSREKEIIRASGVGIVVNLLLSAFKAGVGALSGSIAIILDAVNNLSDALSSIITIIGAKLATRRPTKNHPLGYGRIEYFSATVISLIVLVAGVTSLRESIHAIIHGGDTHYGAAAFVVMIAAVAGKLLLGLYTRRVGKRVQSQSLIASGTDSLFDAVVTSSTIISAVVMVVWQVNVDGWLGIVISVVIIKAGFDLIRVTLNDLLGARVGAETTRRLKRRIVEYPGVSGAYDMILNNYGPEFTVGSVNIEVPDDMKASDIYLLTRRMQNEIYADEGVVLYFGIYAVCNDPESREKREMVYKALADEKDVVGTHAFYMERESKTIRLDVVCSFDVLDFDAYREHLVQKLIHVLPDYRFVLQVEYDVSD